jgi:hypothetical protein
VTPAPIGRAQPVADVILRDGRTLRLRAPQRADRDALVAFLDALSSASMSARYHVIGTTYGRPNA